MSSSVKLSLVSFGDDVRRAYARLFAGDPDKAPALLDWRFAANPHGAAKFAVAMDGGEVVGMIALVPTRLRSGGKAALGYQAIDTMVDEAYRGHGLFVKLGALAQVAERLGGSVLWGLPNANAAPGWYGRLGWRNFGPVPMLIRPLRSGFVLGRVHKALGRLDVPLVGRPSETFDTLGPADLQGFDELWADLASPSGTSIDRSAAWLRWRLFDKPGTDYRVVGARQGSRLDALVATRIADKHGARLCYVMDALARPSDGESLTRMLRSELAAAAAAGAGAALAWCPAHAPAYRSYRRAGFLPFPARFRPIEINFGARPLDAKAGEVVAAPWTLSLLDSDTN